MTTTIGPGKTAHVKARIYRDVLSLLRHARGHHLRAQFTARPRSGQKGIVKQIILKL
jgi:hypothetical protein